MRDVAAAPAAATTELELPLTRRAAAALDRVRQEFAWVRPDSTTLVTEARSKWWTFGGLLANAALAEALGDAGLPVQSRNNLAIAFSERVAAERIHDGLVPLQQRQGPGAAPRLAEEALETLKFAWLVPRERAVEQLRARLSDPRGVDGVVGEPILTATPVD